jgi:predicted nucleotidyltransferase component of viral defense system
LNPILESLLVKYHPKKQRDYENALKEIVQEIALLGLWRANFFEHAAFYGGTALRILHSLNRYSEDLDFSLLRPDSGFKLKKYHAAVKDELFAFGFEGDIESISKHEEGKIDSSFIKLNTAKHFLHVQAPPDLVRRVHPMAALKIKFEIDVDPPPDFNTETIAVQRPVPFSVKAYALPDLFAGKISAVLCRRWKHRVKGRDWYDFLWFVNTQVPIHLEHLRQRLIQSEFIEPGEAFGLIELQAALRKKLDGLDIDLAKADVVEFRVLFP